MGLGKELARLSPASQLQTQLGLVLLLCELDMIGSPGKVLQVIDKLRHGTEPSTQ